MLEGVVNPLSMEWHYLTKRITNKYYIIRRGNLGAGFFSNYYWVMGHLVFARKWGYVPAVDMLNYKTLYSEDNPIDGELNAWNYYFDNVGAVSLEEAYESGRYVLGRDEPLHRYANRFCDENYRFPTDKAIDYYYPFIHEHIRIRESIELEFTREWEKKASHPDKIIGIHIRGTDMKNNLGHPMPAHIDRYIEEVETLMQEDKTIQGIFLATDEKKVVEHFQNHFRGKCDVLFMEAFRSDEQEMEHKTGIHEQIIENPRENHKYKMGMEVLHDAWCLSRCGYLVCGHSNITNVVVLWNNHKFWRVICVESGKS